MWPLCRVGFVGEHLLDVVELVYLAGVDLLQTIDAAQLKIKMGL
jgi:hypothetical protein